MYIGRLKKILAEKDRELGETRDMLSEQRAEAQTQNMSDLAYQDFADSQRYLKEEIQKKESAINTLQRIVDAAEELGIEIL